MYLRVSVIYELMNFHVHSTWSEGTYTPELIVREAIKRKVDKIAITDYYNTKKTNSLPPKYIAAYQKDLHTLRDKYRSEIDIYIGLEIDFSPRTDIEHLPDFDGIDFLLFEYVQDNLWDGYPLWMLIELRDRYHLPVILSHNDVSRNFQGTDISSMLRVLESDRIGIELNTNLNYTRLGVPYYRLFDNFFEALRDQKIPISVGSDMHKNLELLTDVSDALSFIQDMHLEENFKLFLKEIDKNER